MDATVAQQSKEERADSEQEESLPQDDAQLPREAEAEGFNLIDKALYNFNTKVKIPLDFKKDLQYYTIMRERADYGRVYTPIVATFLLGILGAVQLILENVLLVIYVHLILKNICREKSIKSVLFLIQMKVMKMGVIGYQCTQISMV